MNPDERPIGRATRYIPPELRAPQVSVTNENDIYKKKRVMKNKQSKAVRNTTINSLDRRVESINLDDRRPASYGAKYNYDVDEIATSATTLFDKSCVHNNSCTAESNYNNNSNSGNKNNSKNNNPETIKEAAVRLTDSKSYSWKLRLGAIEYLQESVKDANKHDELSAALVMLLNPLIAQCRDLRSAIVRETCNLLKLFATNLQDKFSTIAPAITKTLLMITGGGNKVIAGYCGECAIEIVKHTQSKKSIDLFVSLCKSRSKIVREKSLTCLCICLESWSPTNWLHNTKNINNGITIGLNDPSPTARKIAKRAYEAFELHSPEDAQILMSTLDKRTLSKLNSSSKSLALSSSNSSSSSSRSLNSSSSSSFSSSLKHSHRRRPSNLNTRLIDGSESIGVEHKEGRINKEPPPSPPSRKECNEWVLSQRVKGDPVCYWNSRTNETSWTDHWIPMFKEIQKDNDKNGAKDACDKRRFYYNVETKKTSWTLPESDSRSPRHINSNTPKNM